MRSRRKADPFAAMGEPEIARCREAAAADFSYAVADLSAAVADVARADSARARLLAAFAIYRCTVRAASVSMRYLRLGAHAPGVACAVAPAAEVRWAARAADRDAARRVG